MQVEWAHLQNPRNVLGSRPCAISKATPAFSQADKASRQSKYPKATEKSVSPLYNTVNQPRNLNTVYQMSNLIASLSAKKANPTRSDNAERPDDDFSSAYREILKKI